MTQFPHDQFAKNLLESLLAPGGQIATALKIVIMRQLKRRVGDLSIQIQDRIKSLPVEKLENLGDALLDFAGMEDLTAWLDTNC